MAKFKSKYIFLKIIKYEHGIVCNNSYDVFCLIPGYFGDYSFGYIIVEHEGNLLKRLFFVHISVFKHEGNFSYLHKPIYTKNNVCCLVCFIDAIYFPDSIDVSNFYYP